MQGDEGRGKNRKPFFVQSFQCALQQAGHSFLSRMLHTVFPSEQYVADDSIEALNEDMAKDCIKLFYDGFEVP